MTESKSAWVSRIPVCRLCRSARNLDKYGSNCYRKYVVLEFSR